MLQRNGKELKCLDCNEYHPASEFTTKSAKDPHRKICYDCAEKQKEAELPNLLRVQAG